MYITAQIIMGISYVILFIALYSKQKKWILLLQALSNLFMAFGFIFLNANAAGVMCFISSFRYVIYYFLEKENLERTRFNMLFNFSLLIILSTMLTYNSALDLLPLYSSLIMNLASYLTLLIPLKFLYITGNVSYIIFDVFVKNYTGIIGEFVVLSITLFAMIKHIVNKEIRSKVSKDFHFKNIYLFRMFK